MTNRRDFVQPQIGSMGFVGSMKTIGRVVTITVADNVTANTVEAFRVPAGFAATGIIANVGVLDSGAAMTFSVGDTLLGTRYLSASTLGRTPGGIVTAFSTPAVTNVAFLYTVDTSIFVTITAQATTAVAGTIALYLVGFMAQ